MLQSFNRSNQPMIPPMMENYIHNRVSRRAAYLSGQMSLQLEIAKSEQLIGIEERYRNDLIKRAQRAGRRP